MFRKKIETFSVHVIKTLLTGAAFTSHAVSEIKVLIFLTHCRVLPVWVLTVFKCSKIRSKVGSFYPWNHTERWISQPIFVGPQSPLDDFKATFWDLCKTYRIWLQQGNMCIAPRAKSIFGPIWVRKCRKNLKNFTDIHSKSIKSAGKRSWTDTLETCPGFFLDKFISRRISVSTTSTLKRKEKWKRWQHGVYAD